MIRIASLAGVALALAGAPCPAQTLADPERGAITVFSPPEWTGQGTRGGITATGRAVLVEGLAHHRSGVSRVTVDGNPATLLRDSSGATRFRVRVPPPRDGRAVEIVAYPVDGSPFVRMQFADGTFQTAVLAAPAALPLWPRRVLRVSLAGLGSDSERELRGAAQALGDIELTPVEAHLTVTRNAGGDYHVVGRDGSVRHRVAPKGGAAELMRALEQERESLQFAELPAPAWFNVEFRFPDGAGIFSLGAPIEFEVTAGHDGYLTVVDLGTDGTVGVLFPVMEEDSRIRAGEVVRLPTTAMRSYFAPEPPYLATAPTGQGLVRAFVTSRPLRLPSAAEGAPDPAELLRALYEAVQGGGAWGAATLSYGVVP